MGGRDRGRHSHITNKARDEDPKREAIDDREQGRETKWAFKAIMWGETIGNRKKRRKNREVNRQREVKSQGRRQRQRSGKHREIRIENNKGTETHLDREKHEGRVRECDREIWDASYSEIERNRGGRETQEEKHIVTHSRREGQHTRMG